MVYNNSFAVERGWFVVCLEPAFKNSQTIFHRVLHYHLHSPISHVLGGRVQERQSLSSSLIPPPSLSRCQSPPPTPLPDTNSLPIALAKISAKSLDRPKQLLSTANSWSGTTALAEQHLRRVRERQRRGGLGNPKRPSFQGTVGPCGEKKLEQVMGNIGCGWMPHMCN